MKKYPDVDMSILDYIRGHGIVRLHTLVTELGKKGRGYSEPAIKRKLSRLVEKGYVHRLEPSEYQKYGIDEKDGRVTFYIATEEAEFAEYFDQILQYLSSNDMEDVLFALDEIEFYKGKFTLTPSLLNALIPLLDRDESLVVASLSILHNYIVQKSIFPTDTHQLVSNLRKVLQIIGNLDKPKQVIVQTIEILGYYQDPVVIDYLEYIAQDDKILAELQGAYKSPRIAPLIEKNRLRLAKLEHSLRKSNLKDSARIVREIRQEALANVTPSWLETVLGY